MLAAENELIDSSTVNPSGHLVLNIILSNMRDLCGAVPKEFLGLSRRTDLLAPRGFWISNESYLTYCARLDAPWPYPVVRVMIDNGVDRPITVIPGVKTVVAEAEYNSPLTLVAGIERIFLGGFTQPLEDLPDSLLELEISSHLFNHPLTLPPNLRWLNLKYAYSFNQPIILPASIRLVSLGGRFDHPLLLPPNVESLEFGVCCNTALEVMLHGMEYEDGRFNRPLTLPDSIKKVCLSMSFNQPLTLGGNVEALYLKRDFNQPITLPPALKVLYLDCRKFDYPLDIPPQVHTLYMSCYDIADRLERNVPRLAFPPELKDFGWNCNLRVIVPETAKIVKFGPKFRKPVIIPEGAEEVWFLNPNYKKRLVLPSTLKLLYLSDRYSLPLELPPGCVRRVEP